MKKCFYTLLLVFVLMVLPMLVQVAAAQPPPPDTKPIPIDGGLAFLIIAGAAYGARKIYKQRKQEDVSHNQKDH